MTLLPLGTGKCSTFGGPLDAGVGSTEGLGLIELSDLKEYWFRRLFLAPSQWNNAEGLARNLNPDALYCAMRWGFGSYDGKQGEILVGKTREEIRRMIFLVEVPGKFCFVQGADSGPGIEDRLIDFAPGATKILGVGTDSVVTVSAIV